MPKKNSTRAKIVIPANKDKFQTAWSARQLSQLTSIEKGGFSPQRLLRILRELVNGYKFVHHYKKAVTVFGSARCGFADQVYQDATALGYGLAKEGYAVITGGGPGIMEAANKGAEEAGGKSIGLNIQLQTEQRTNSFVNASSSFHYFFTRKVMLASASQVYVFFPGGFGTMDELFEMLTLVQTKKVSPVAIIMVNKQFWKPLARWVESVLYKKHYAISEGDTKLYHVVDHAGEALRLIKKLERQGRLHPRKKRADLWTNKREGVVMPGDCLPETDKKKQPKSRKG